MRKKGLLFLLIGGILVFSLTGCFGGVKYQVDYDGCKDSFRGAKDSYRAGAKVKLYYDYVATDTDYSFFLDDERLSPDFNGFHTYIIRFTMPDHDVKLTMESHNSMNYIPPAEEEFRLPYDSFDGGGPAFTVKIDDPSLVSYTVERTYDDENHEELDGAGYTETFVFRGLAPGETKVTISGRSPVGENFDDLYYARINKDLQVSLESHGRLLVDDEGEAEK